MMHSFKRSAEDLDLFGWMYLLMYRRRFCLEDFEAKLQQPLNLYSHTHGSDLHVRIKTFWSHTHLLSDQRPVLYVGSGIRLGGAYQELLDFLRAGRWQLLLVGTVMISYGMRIRVM